MANQYNFQVQMVQPIEQQYYNDTREAFNLFDQDHSGYLDKKEFEAFLKAAGKKEHAKYLYKIVDSNHDGKISFDEFWAFMQTMIQIQLHRDLSGYLRMIFDACDHGKGRGRDGREIKKGYLTRKEFFKFLEITTAKKHNFLDNFLNSLRFDRNGDGKITFEEIMTQCRFNLGL
ncbi:EF hand family protein [Histomonas meleagridis]|uniref:EF hand family protein n=1 Tax=Histomonas meleagridis TaxID=135588 RepID=UPI00355AAB8B|nr:EF hand family protein [Histomonas meleagridis]KAH0804585.1 EF hand family protein [Histomonas meleagridis]